MYRPINLLLLLNAIFNQRVLRGSLTNSVLNIDSVLFILPLSDNEVDVSLGSRTLVSYLRIRESSGIQRRLTDKITQIGKSNVTLSTIASRVT